MSDAQWKQLADYHRLCLEFGQQESVVSLSWLLSRPGVTSPLLGPRSANQLGSLVKALEWKLPEELDRELDKLFPGYGTAPKAYFGVG